MLRTHILGHACSHWSEETQGNKEIQVFFKRSKEVIKVEILEIYKGMFSIFIDFSDLLASCVTGYVWIDPTNFSAAMYMTHVIIYLYVEISYFECINKKKLILPQIRFLISPSESYSQSWPKNCQKKGKERLKKNGRKTEKKLNMKMDPSIQRVCFFLFLLIFRLKCIVGL